jgi:hypothetical protein
MRFSVSDERVGEWSFPAAPPDGNERQTKAARHVPFMGHGTSVNGWERTPERSELFDNAR